GWLKARDWAPEQQLGSRPVGERPAPAGLETGGQSVEPGFGPGHSLTHDVKVFDLTAAEQGVVDGHQGREVLVDGGGLHAEAAGYLGEAEAIDPFFGHDLGSDVEDLLDGLSATSGTSVNS